MRKIYTAVFSTLTVIMLLSCLSLAGCGTIGKVFAPNELDKKIREASNYLNERIPAGRKIAFISIQSDSPALSEYMIDEFITNAVNDNKFSVVDRQQLNAARAELNFNMSGEVSDQSAQSVGQMLGAQTIVTGKVSKIGKSYRFNIRALEVETVQVQGSQNFDIAAGGRINDLMASAAPAGSSQGNGNSGTASAGNRTTTQTPARQSGLKNGTYTFYPRLRATKAGLPVDNVFIGQITVAGGYMTIHFARTAEGAWNSSTGSVGSVEWDYAPSGFYHKENFTLQDLDNPSRSYNPASDQSSGNGMGRIWSITFNQINSRRFKLTFLLYPGENPPYIFDEIIIGEPDK